MTAGLQQGLGGGLAHPVRAERAGADGEKSTEADEGQDETRPIHGQA
jgi:hypothetical protein